MVSQHSSGQRSQADERSRRVPVLAVALAAPLVVGGIAAHMVSNNLSSPSVHAGESPTSTQTSDRQTPVAVGKRASSSVQTPSPAGPKASKGSASANGHARQADAGPQRVAASGRGEGGADSRRRGTTAAPETAAQRATRAEATQRADSTPAVQRATAQERKAAAAGSESAGSTADASSTSAPVTSPRSTTTSTSSTTSTPSTTSAGSTTSERPSLSRARVATGTGITGEVVRLTNAERAEAGCGPLSVDPALTRAAQGHASDMVAQQYFDHTGKDGSSPFDRMKEAGFGGSMMAENIAAGQQSASAVVQGWMNSAGHRKNILNCSYDRIGVGYDAGAVKPGMTGSWVQNFGKA